MTTIILIEYITNFINVTFLEHNKIYIKKNLKYFN
jgi:hypothetical protein